MAWLPAWSELLRDGFEEFVCASCQFNSVHKKEFRFVAYLLNAEKLEVKCPGGHEHVRIEGSYMHSLLRSIRGNFQTIWLQVLRRHFGQSDGYEMKSLMCTGMRAQLSTISLLPHHGSMRSVGLGGGNLASTFLRVMRGLAVLATVAETTRDARFVRLMDSRVAKGALAKGRSASRALQLVCGRSAALQIAYGLFPGWCFAPNEAQYG